MITRDKILEYNKETIEDGFGGVNEVLTPTLSFDCKVSVSNDVAKATAYGVLAEQVLDIISSYELQLSAIYEYAGKKYSCRKAFRKGRYCYSTLVEVK